MSGDPTGGRGPSAGLVGTPGRLVDRHDVLLLDLDGTVWLSGTVLPHAVDVLGELAGDGVRSVYVTNNASRSPEEVAAQLATGGLPAAAADVVTSAQAGATLLAGLVPAGAAVLVVGSAALVAEAAARGLTPVGTADVHAGRLRTPGPDGSDRVPAVLQGYTPETGWRDLAAACHVVAAGAVWVAANVDATLPTPEGLAPGNGSLVGVVATVTGRRPAVAGKPERPLLDAAVQRTGARTPLVVGDRLDTDIAAAVGAGMPGLLVLTGVSTPLDLVTAPPAERPTQVATDLRGLLRRHPDVVADSGGHRCGGWRAAVLDGVVRLERSTGGPKSSARDATGAEGTGTGTGTGAGDSGEGESGPGDPGTQDTDGLDGLRALAAAVWAHADARARDGDQDGAPPEGLDEALDACDPSRSGPRPGAGAGAVPGDGAR